MEGKNKTQEGIKKREKQRKAKKTEGGEKEQELNFSFIRRSKREILKLIFNAINCLMKHCNLSC